MRKWETKRIRRYLDSVPDKEEEQHTAEAAELVGHQNEGALNATAHQTGDDVDDEEDGGHDGVHAQATTLQNAARNNKKREMDMDSRRK